MQKKKMKYKSCQYDTSKADGVDRVRDVLIVVAADEDPIAAVARKPRPGSLLGRRAQRTSRPRRGNEPRSDEETQHRLEIKQSERVIWSPKELSCIRKELW